MGAAEHPKPSPAQGFVVCAAAQGVRSLSLSPPVTGTASPLEMPLGASPEPPALLLKEAELRILKACSFVWGFISLED